MIRETGRKDRRGARVSAEARADLIWWLTFVDEWNGHALILNGSTIRSPLFASDASDFAVGAVFGRQVVYLKLNEEQQQWHINVKELFALLVAVRQWGHLFIRSHVSVTTWEAKLDNTSAIAWINKGTSTNKNAIKMLRELFWRSATKGFRVTCSHIPGKHNIIADAASRLRFDKIPPKYEVTEARKLTDWEKICLKKLNDTS